MSLQSALKEAKKIHEYMIMVQEGSVPGVYKTSDTEYFVNDDGDDFHVPRETLVLHTDTGTSVYCEHNIYKQYISYCKNQDVITYNPDFSAEDTVAPYSVLDGAWDTEEFYFQQSTVYDEKILDAIVIMWYFKSIDSCSFYFDYECVAIAVEKGNVITEFN